MIPITVDLIFDIGRTNKKVFVLGQQSEILDQQYKNFEETVDEDGFPSEDLQAVSAWVLEMVDHYVFLPKYNVKGVNFSTYGASMVHLDEDGKIVGTFYNYLKEFPAETAARLKKHYPNLDDFSIATQSPYMGFLNSGLQLLFLKYERPESFARIDCSLHLPQYFTFLLTGQKYSEFTSIGCHTGLWDLERKSCAKWLKDENLLKLLPVPSPTDQVIETVYKGVKLNVGLGIHDSSSTLIPYLQQTEEPFVLLSTGTWSISMNPFNQSMLDEQTLAQDCMNFMTINGQSVLASRLLLGKHYAEQVKLLNAHFGVNEDLHKTLPYQVKKSKRKEANQCLFNHHLIAIERFGLQSATKVDLSIFQDFEEAYWHLMDELTDAQVKVLELALGGQTSGKIFVDGGFVHNQYFMQMLKEKLPTHQFLVTEQGNGACIGAAIMLNDTAVLHHKLQNKVIC
ncbi:FGGY family carbohydrate kinase [Persicobacter psychrovividus]|uniref:Carbohydrate kinase n=1 Tax=Persicobacter psychrovividus TaxID=387638 RepID=A0ABM7VII9_9BACT|nr:carbohydrate kinase [Persicobacter psychrovividus]